jgi:signal transduction histidine kinase
MRTRLIALLVLLLGCVLAALSVPYARNLAANRQQAMFVDRLQDTSRFASAAQQATNGVDEQALRDDLARYADLYGITAVVLDRNGQARTAAGAPLDLHRRVVAEGVRRALAGHQSGDPALIWPWSDQPIVVAVPVISSGDVIGAVVTVSSTARLRASVGRDLELLAVAELAALVVLVAVASRLATWVLRPVYVLSGAAHQISAGDLSTRVCATQGPVELRRLGTSFNTMAQAVQNAMERERAFVADASHQLRNPLAALVLRLEALAVGLDEPRREKLSLVREEAAQLSLILDELLELASAEHVRAEPVVVDLVELVAGRVAVWQPMADQRSIRLHQPLNGPVHALVDPALVGSALDGVLDNAVKFSPADSQVTVRVVEEPATARVDVSDTGPGVADDELARVGDRFWRSRSSQNIPGSGLGLSIARTLLDASGGELAFTAVEPHGLCVTLRLPRAAREVA